MTKTPVDSAREFMGTIPGRDIRSDYADLKLHLRAVIEYAESLERQLKKPKCPKCYDTGKLHGCQRQGKHGLEYYSADCDCKTGEREELEHNG